MVELPDELPPDEPFEALPAAAPARVAKPREDRSRPVPAARNLPMSVEAEEYLISSCLLDPLVIGKCMEAHVTPESFYDAKHGLIFGYLLRMAKEGKPCDTAVLMEEMSRSKDLERVGGVAFLVQVSGRIPTSAQAAYFVTKVRELQLLRELIRTSTLAIEAAHAHAESPGEIDSLLESARLRLAQIGSGTSSTTARPIMSYGVPAPGDVSIILGNRFLNRGDGGVLVSTSGMGKSSMSIQMACGWALGRSVFGIKPNGVQRSLIVQAEDSEGDVGEVSASVAAGMKLTPEETAQVNGRVLLATERTRRGPAFIAWLRGLIARHKPDIVWINPLQAFISGDITDAADLGAFLREGLNSLNDPPTFGYVLVHHTTKPPQEKKDRLWNEVMYDMAGGAEIINWARFVISLRAEDTEGKFKMVLAKRGRRAGVTKQVPAGAGFRTEIVTAIGVQYSTGTCVTTNGLTIPMLYWDEGELAPPKDKEDDKDSKRGSNIADFRFVFIETCPSKSQAKPFAQLHRLTLRIRKTTATEFQAVLDEAVRTGMLMVCAAGYHVP